ncbi:MAG: hypothetical protein ACK47N_18760 [Microcystis sp.]|jgi:hypothetical protein|uniref:Uncharacterized protein n=2 Tax=Microcystis TaxID=1125 RepID=A0A841USA9_MICAE|nr:MULTISPECIES: hypothetical protein [Microcystis]NCQ92710.1 hypothetical protein [Microcystis aeruginosa LG13-13]NCR05863.1 hypothetical protein [Microcystis aeruginosa LG13-03]NCR64139.1 hypothetical protein [Microcystis aeruginosa LG11-05]REJ49120.1 MAG: hypothetical protein DWQ53_03760 [Microcystis flos-aquae DF17]MBC1193058.1 hypothetical protein [Microcystis aeruginosa BLCC-F108]
MMILANVIWPSLYLVERINTWWIVGISLLIEFLCLIWLTQEKIWKVGLMTLVMNLVSTVVGIVGIPLSGIVWELIATITIHPLFHWGTFNPVTWIVSCILAALLNAVVEVMSLIWIFKFRWTAKIFWCLVIANGITVSIAYWTILLTPPGPM